MLIYAAWWLLIFGGALFGPPLLAACGGWVRAALGSAWVTAAVGGVLAGKSPLTKAGQGHRLLEWLALAAPYVFITDFSSDAGSLASVIIRPSTM